MTQETLSRTINLPAASFLIIGYVVGATIFILPGSLAAEAGPAIYIAYLMAAVPAVLACFVMAVIGSAIPASGSLYLIIRDVLSPSLGFLYLWLMVVVAAMTAYFSYAGVFIIAEVAGEIKNPGRTIPLAIFLSFTVIILLYTLVPLALTSVLDWETMGSTRMAVVTASQIFMPGWLVTFIAAGALFAAATSVNGIMMGLSRDFYKGAKSGLFPRYFAAIHRRHVALPADHA